MNDFTEFDAFQLCRDFARAIAVPLNGGVFARDPVLVTQLRKTIISIYSNFAEGFERDGNREFPNLSQFRRGPWVKLEGNCFMPWISAICRSSNLNRSIP
jgi:23S rRNA-intervening sequence protein